MASSYTILNNKVANIQGVIVDLENFIGYGTYPIKSEWIAAAYEWARDNYVKANPNLPQDLQQYQIYIAWVQSGAMIGSRSVATYIPIVDLKDKSNSITSLKETVWTAPPTHTLDTAPPESKYTEKVDLHLLPLPWLNRANAEGFISATAIPMLNGIEYMKGFKYVHYTLNWDTNIMTVYYVKVGSLIGIAAVLGTMAMVGIAIGFIIDRVTWSSKTMGVVTATADFNKMLSDGKITVDQYKALMGVYTDTIKDTTTPTDPFAGLSNVMGQAGGIVAMALVGFLLIKMMGKGEK